MIMIIDVDAARARVGLVGRGGASWRVFGPREIPSAVGAAMRELGRSRPSAVAAVLGGEGRSPTWSGMRAMVALANAFAFAWGVPAVRLDVPADAGDDEVAAAAHAATDGADATSRVHAEYDGLPNITVAKGRL